MEISEAGTFSLHLALIQPIYNGKTVTLRHVLRDERGEVWCLPDQALCKPSFVPGAMAAARPGEGLLFLRFEEGGAFWGIELASLENIEQRAERILQDAHVVRDYLTIIPHYSDFREYVDAVDRLPASCKGPCIRGTNTFDNVIDGFRKRLDAVRSRAGFPMGEPISAASFETLLGEYNLWNDLQPRVKGFLRKFIHTISADGEHTHDHPVGLTESRRSELVNVAGKLAATIQADDTKDTPCSQR